MTLLVPVDQNHGVSTASAQSSRGPVRLPEEVHLKSFIELLSMSPPFLLASLSTLQPAESSWELSWAFGRRAQGQLCNPLGCWDWNCSFRSAGLEQRGPVGYFQILEELCL
ncbi:uncharacterized protein AAG666_006322 isoform 1-T2 [Megaptera novaeangliae]